MQEDALDEQLVDALAEASNGEGLAFFTMPRSDDLTAIPQDPNNPLTPAKVELGRLLFHESALMTSPAREQALGTGSCATCHHVNVGFHSGRRQGIGEGGTGYDKDGFNRTAHPDWPDTGALDVQPIRAPATLNVAYQKVVLWNGRLGSSGPNSGTEDRWTGTLSVTNHLGYEGVETQAIAGLSFHRMGRVDTSIATRHPVYTDLFEQAFPGEPIDRERAGLAIAAYERTILATEAPFQRWLRGSLSAMSAQEKRGALVFFGKAQCSSCHTGPALNSMTFHALGMQDLRGSDVFGPTGGDEILGRGGFTGREADMYAFKTPQLYNLRHVPFLGHGSTFTSVREVIEYKNRAVPQNAYVPEHQLSSRFKPLRLTASEIDDLVAFVEHALYDPDLGRYTQDTVPSGSCIPADDPQSRRDLNCETE